MNNYYILFIHYFFAIIFFTYGLLLQKISQMANKSVFYGVRIPMDYETNTELRFLHKKYQRNISLSFAGFLAVLSLILVFSSEEIAVWLLTPQILVWLAILAVNYVYIYRKVKDISARENWAMDTNVVYVDTNYRSGTNTNDRISVSSIWYVIPAMILLVTVIGLFLKSIVPDFGISKETLDIFDEGFPALTIIFIQMLINLIFFVNNKIIRKAKQSLNGGKIGEVRNRSRKIRFVQSIGLLLLSIFINLSLMLMAFSMSDIIDKSFMMYSTVLTVVMPFIIVIGMFIAIGRSSKEHKDISLSEGDKQIVNRADDQNYLFGSLYYNKKDPALFVEKRLGIGFTINFAKPAAKVIGGFVILILISVIVLLAYMPSFTKERNVEVSNGSISVSGVWGTEINKDQIENISIEQQLPHVLMKTNGAAIGKKLFGHFKLEGYDKSVLFVGDMTKPFIAVHKKDGGLVLINYADTAETRELYDKIKDTMNK